MNAEEMRSRIAELSSLRYSLTSEKHKREWELEREAKLKCFEEFKDRFAVIDNELTPLENAYREIMEKRAIEEKVLPYPEGTIMVHWERPCYFSNAHGNYRTTGDRGILQIFRKGDSFPSNQHWGCPRVGDVVIRRLKKDGSPGIQAEQYGYGRGIWVAEGEDPNAEGFKVKKVETKEKPEEKV
jgi:hypothetical protein